MDKKVGLFKLLGIIILLYSIYLAGCMEVDNDALVSDNNKGLNIQNEHKENNNSSDKVLLVEIPDKSVKIYKEDLNNSLLSINGINYHYNWFCMEREGFPKAFVGDFDDDGSDEICLVFYVGYGSGVSKQELHIIEFDKETVMASHDHKDIVFDEDYYLPQLDGLIESHTFLEDDELFLSISILNETHQVSLKEYQQYGSINQEVYYGDVINFEIIGDKIIAELALGISYKEISFPEYIGQINVDLEYNDGVYSFGNISFMSNL